MEHYDEINSMNNHGIDTTSLVCSKGSPRYFQTYQKSSKDKQGKTPLCNEDTSKRENLCISGSGKKTLQLFIND